MAEKLIQVSFVDEDGNSIGKTELPADRLPASFALHTTLNIGDSEWSVLEATPAESSEFIETGSLLLKLAKVETVNPQDMLYSLPSLCAKLPTIGGEAATDAAFNLDLHEDEWRQSEFLPLTAADSIDEELRKIRQIWEEHSQKLADQNWTVFRKCHIRADIAGSCGLTIDELKEALGESSSGSLSIGGKAVTNGFALKTSTQNYYGTLDGERVAELGVHQFRQEERAEVEKLAKTFGIVFVDWCSCIRI